MLLNVLQIVQMVLAVLLIISILLQQKGSGMGASMGGGGGIVSTRRGVDLFLYKATIFLSVIFFAIGISFIVLS